MLLCQGREVHNTWQSLMEKIGCSACYLLFCCCLGAVLTDETLWVQRKRAMARACHSAPVAAGADGAREGTAEAVAPRAVPPWMAVSTALPY